MQGKDVAKVDDFKYQGSAVQRNGACGREVKRRVRGMEWVEKNGRSDLRQACEREGVQAVPD